VKPSALAAPNMRASRRRPVLGAIIYFALFDIAWRQIKRAVFRRSHSWRLRYGRLAPHVDMRCQSIDDRNGVVGTPDVAGIGIEFLHIGTHDGLQEFARCHDLFLLKHRLDIAAG